MAKKHRKQKGMGFAIFMVVYAVLGIAGICFGLKWFWGCIAAYEASRPHGTIDAYMATVTKDRIVEDCDVVIEKADFNIQSEDACYDYLMDALQGEITYARKASACTDTEQTYILRTGDRVIGSFTIAAEQEDKYGFTPWVLREEKFDLSDLMGTETISVTVPQGYGVWVNGVQLDESYIVEEERREFAVLKEFYKSYELPQLVLQTYEAGPFLNAEFEMEVYDEEGRPFVMDENFDENSLIEMKDMEKVQQLDKFLDKFIDIYVVFAGCANDNRYANYNKVIQYVVPESDLAQRMYDALEGMQFAQSRGDEVADIQVHHYVQLEEGKYLCDVTYKVNTTGHEGVVQTTTNCKFILVESGGKLLVESMIGY